MSTPGVEVNLKALLFIFLRCLQIHYDKEGIIQKTIRTCLISYYKEVTFKKAFKKLLLPEPIVPENYTMRAIE